MLKSLIEFSIISTQVIFVSALILRQIYFLKQNKDPIQAIVPKIRLPKSQIHKDLEREAKTTKLLNNG